MSLHGKGQEMYKLLQLVYESIKINKEATDITQNSGTYYKQLYTNIFKYLSEMDNALEIYI